MTAPATTRLRNETWLLAILLGVGSLALFCVNISSPTGPYFDETHYVPAARALIERSGPINIEHPLFSKTLIAAGMLLFGDNGTGWRMSGAVMATIAVLAVFWIARMLFRDARAAAMTALLLVFNQTHFIQARIAMLEMPMTACLLLGLAFLMHARESRPGRRAAWELAGAAMLGLAVGAKWLAIPYVALFLAASAIASWIDHDRDLRQLVTRILPWSATLGVAAVVTYLATFLPAFFYHREPMTLAHLPHFQLEMLSAQKAPAASHPYQSVWWQWPLMLRPMWYSFEKTGGSYRGILLVGNPLIYWGGVASVAVFLSGWKRQRTRSEYLTVGLYLFSLLLWIAIPKKIEFFFYYNLSAIWLCFVLGAAFVSFGARGRRALPWFTIASGCAFIYFFPIIAAQALPTDDTWTHWVWFKSWY